MWRCPLCHSPLTVSSPAWYCVNRHNFDVARTGYVNLLPVQQKNSLRPGDDKNMLRGRRAFHQAQGYATLIHALTESVVRHHASRQSPLRFYDAGCGEGTYLAECGRLLAEAGISTTLAGSDISKVAVEMAAKAIPAAQFVVASSFTLPLAEGSQDIILQVFAPGDAKELSRVLAPDGLLLTVEPGPRHLWELKREVYAQPVLHQQSDGQKPGFTQVSQQSVTFSLHFTSDAQKDGLFTMTPYVWKMDDAKRAQLSKNLDSVSADFIITVWQKPQVKQYEQ